MTVKTKNLIRELLITHADELTAIITHIEFQITLPKQHRVLEDIGEGRDDVDKYLEELRIQKQKYILALNDFNESL